MILLLFSLLIVFSINDETNQTSHWKLEVKNEKMTNETIVLKPNQYTKVILSVSHLEELNVLDYSFDRSKFTVKLDSEDKLKMYGDKVVIVPSVSLEYIVYIGLKCGYKESEIQNLKFKVDSTKDLDDQDLEDASLDVEEVPLEINEDITLLELEPIETNLTGEGYSLFRLKNEIYNMEDIEIISDDKNDDYKFEGVKIEAFKDREKEKKEEEFNGILFDGKFSVEQKFENLKEKSLIFNLAIKDADKDGKCLKYFELSEDSKVLSIEVNENPILTVNDAVKQAILYTMENITPKRDVTNNIQIKMTLPVAPLIIDCDLKGEGEKEDDDEINFKDYIVNSGSYVLKFDDLNSNNEYKIKCDFTTVNKKEDKFTIKLGNEKNSDFITPLFPSRTSDSIPQCLEFIFKSEEEEKLEDEVKKFTDLSEKLCQKVMSKDEDVISRIEGKFKCQKAVFSEDIEKNKINRAIICIGASEKFKSKRFIDSLDNETNTHYYEEHVEEFVGLIDTTEKIKDAFKSDDVDDIKHLELVEFKRYYDLDSPDINKIKLELNSKETKKKKDLEFNISTTNEQPIECFYNEELQKDHKKRFMALYFNRGVKSITLYPNEQKTIKVYLSDSSLKRMYSLYMNCYNLPGAKIRYEQTNVFNAYTYLYIEEEYNQYVVPPENVTINCAEKNNRINPHCLKGQYNSLLNRLKTRMPIIDKDEELEKFNKLSNEAQLDLLKTLEAEWEKKIKPKKKNIEFLEDLIYMAQYLSNRDCSAYAKGNTNKKSETIDKAEYKECRKTKKEIHKKIIDFFKDSFTCDNIVNLIGQEGLSKDVEDNVKYIIYLIQELSNDAESFNKGESEILFNMVTCLETNFNSYWEEVEQYLKINETLDQSIIAVKKDLEILLIQSLANLVKILHFEEIDGYISRSVTEAGILKNNKGEKIYKSIKEFLKHFNEFGPGEYNLSDSIIINVTVNDEYQEKQRRYLLEENEAEIIDEEQIEELEHVVKYDDKGIIVILKPKPLMKRANAYSMQIVRYDSPIMPIKISGNKDDSTLDTFVSITLYDKDGNEISIDDMPENIRPKIIYNRSYQLLL